MFEEGVYLNFVMIIRKVFDTTCSLTVIENLALIFTSIINAGFLNLYQSQEQYGERNVLQVNCCRKALDPDFSKTKGLYFNFINYAEVTAEPWSRTGTIRLF